MNSTKKISELQFTNNLNEDDIHFLVIDKSKTTGEDASDSGKTSRVTLAQVRGAVEASGPKGQRGDDGDRGLKGPQGSQGETGIDGRKGPQGFQGDEGQKGETGLSGEQGIQGIQGVPGVGSDGEKGQKGQQGEHGLKGETSSANSSLVLITSDTIILDSTHNKISKISGGGAWNGHVISSVGFNTFNLSFGINQTNKNMAIGVGIASSSELYDTDVDSIFIGFRFFNDGSYHVMNRHEEISNRPISYRTNSVFNLSFDKIQFTITQDGATVGSFGFGEGGVPNITYAFDSAFYDVGTNLTEFISFTPGANAIRGPKGDQGSYGQKGQPGDSVKGQKGQLGDSVKGQKGEIGVGQKGETGTGIPGQPGPMPTHQWSGTNIRFQAKPGTWGSYVNVKGQTGTNGSNASHEPGTIVMTGRSTSPTGWMLCHGQSLSKTTYKSLFNAIGTTYGGNSSHFNVPDIRGRVVAGESTNNNVLVGAMNLGQKLGSQTHTLTIAEMPKHRHGIGSGDDQVNSQSLSPFRRTKDDNEQTVHSLYEGGDQAHNNVQPTIILNYMIKT